MGAYLILTFIVNLLLFTTYGFYQYNKGYEQGYSECEKYYKYKGERIV